MIDPSSISNMFGTVPCKEVYIRVFSKDDDFHFRQEIAHMLKMFSEQSVGALSAPTESPKHKGELPPSPRDAPDSASPKRQRTVSARKELNYDGPAKETL